MRAKFSDKYLYTHSHANWVVTLWDPIKQKEAFFEMIGHPFGLTGLVFTAEQWH